MKAVPGLDLRRFPDFLILGPQRTGTTWLHSHLRRHPEIMLAEPKELHFFNYLRAPETRRFGSNDLGWYLQCFREPLWRVLYRNGLSLCLHAELYRPKVRGEATASYAALDRELIAEAVALNPQLKAILMVRDPIDRAWSHAKKDLARNRGRSLDQVPPAELERFLTDPYQRRCAQYVKNIENWSAFLQPGHLFIGLFDDIDRRPDGLLLDVMAFLGVKSDRRYLSETRRPVNPTGGEEMPEQYRRLLEKRFAEDLKELRERFGLSWPGGLPDGSAEAKGGASSFGSDRASAAPPHSPSSPSSSSSSSPPLSPSSSPPSPMPGTAPSSPGRIASKKAF